MSVSNPNICRTDTLMSGSGAVSVTAVIAPPCEKPGNLPGYAYDPRDGRMPLVQRPKSPDSGQVEALGLSARSWPGLSRPPRLFCPSVPSLARGGGYGGALGVAGQARRRRQDVIQRDQNPL